jgi:hypothetical protein
MCGTNLIILFVVPSALYSGRLFGRRGGGGGMTTWRAARGNHWTLCLATLEDAILCSSFHSPLSRHRFPMSMGGSCVCALADTIAAGISNHFVNIQL